MHNFAQILETVEVYRDAVVLSPFALVILQNEDGVIYECSDEFAKLLGGTRDDLIDRKLFDFLYPEDLPKTLEAYDALSAGEELTRPFINRYFQIDMKTVKSIEWSDKNYSVTEHYRVAYCREAKEGGLPW